MIKTAPESGNKVCNLVAPSGVNVITTTFLSPIGNLLRNEMNSFYL